METENTGRASGTQHTAYGTRKEFSPMPPAHSNIEWKASLRSYEDARAIAEQLATDRLAPEHQIDTYFRSLEGRLKLRELEGGPAQLIWYDRPDKADAVSSRFVLIPIDDPAAVKVALTEAVGVVGIVDKQREIYLAENVRIHLDRVVGLGEFLEFEAVLDDSIDEKKGHEQVKRLQLAFQSVVNDGLSASYGDMIASTAVQGIGSVD